jgi:hypothetical protein
MFVSASLLFLVQPMVGKMVLPRLGGTPAVWNTCMVFFQAVLLIGYGYTHSLSTWFSRRGQLAMQMVILLMPFAFLMLPFSLGSWTPPGDSNPIASVLWLLMGMVGLPFFVVATSAPLLQKWFADTGHPAGKDPYFLYGASNLGSMLSLVLYPLAVEPLFPIGVNYGEQAWIWTVGYAMLTALIAGCIVLVWRAPSQQMQLAGMPAPVGDPPPAPPPGDAPKTAVQPARRHGRRGIGWTAPQTAPTSAALKTTPKPVTLGRRLRWLALAAVPSSLMLGVTTHLTTDVAAIPFFWVIPLALYLLSFICVFSKIPKIPITIYGFPLPSGAWTDKPHTAVLFLQPFVLTIVIMFVIQGVFMSGVWIAFLLHVSLFFLTALMCHGELAKDRPGTEHLTEFYLWMSLGGVLGGSFNALVAPLIFRFGPTIEYPLAMIAAYFLRPKLIGQYVLIPGDTDAYESTRLGKVLDLAIPVLLGIWTFLAYFTAHKVASFNQAHRFNLGLFRLDLSLFDLTKVLTGMLIIGMFARPIRFGLSLAAFWMITLGFQQYEQPWIFEDRDFFGFVRVRIDYPSDERDVPESRRNLYYALIHGDIDHGWQALGNQATSEQEKLQLRREPLTYFHPYGGIGQVFNRFNWFGDSGSDGFTWPDYRMPAALVGLGASPLDMGWALAAQSQSEPPYACIGLGIGTLGAHAKPFQFVRFYEIQPLVKQLSLPGDGKTPIFHFLQDAKNRGSDIDVILGDGRLTLDKDKVAGYYHILVIDAFASDAIPVHLLTKEAMEMYLSKMAPNGLLIFNTTNRYVELNGVLRDLADELDLTCYYCGAYQNKNVPLLTGSDWVVLQRRNWEPKKTGAGQMPGYVLPPPIVDEVNWVIPDNRGGPIWTDNYSNLLRVMRWR